MRTLKGLERITYPTTFLQSNIYERVKTYCNLKYRKDLRNFLEKLDDIIASFLENLLTNWFVVYNSATCLRIKTWLRSERAGRELQGKLPDQSQY
jgi:hypothetical protein